MFVARVDVDDGLAGLIDRRRRYVDMCMTELIVLTSNLKYLVDCVLKHDLEVVDDVDQVLNKHLRELDNDTLLRKAIRFNS